MQSPAQKPETVDLPVIDPADLKIVRFGAGAAFILLLIVSAVGALLVYGLTLREQSDRQMETEQMLQAEAWASVTKPAREPVDGTPAQAAPVPLQGQVISTPERRARIDRVYQRLDTTSIPNMRAFLIRYREDEYARESGYLEKIQAALDERIAARMDQQRQAEEAEQAEEQTRRTQQQAVPWDMGTDPP